MGTDTTGCVFVVLTITGRGVSIVDGIAGCESAMVIGTAGFVSVLVTVSPVKVTCPVVGCTEVAWMKGEGRDNQVTSLWSVVAEAADNVAFTSAGGAMEGLVEDPTTNSSSLNKSCLMFLS